MKRFAISLVPLLAILLVFSVFGPRPSLASNEVVVLVMSGPEAETLRHVTAQYAKDTGRVVKIMELGRQVQRNLLTQTLMTKSTEIDLGYTSTMEVPTYQAAGVLEPLEAYMVDQKITDPSFNQKDFLVWYKIKGKTYVLPFYVSTHYMFFRKDLIKNPPQTWEEFFKVANEFTNRHNPGSPTTYGNAFTGLIGVEPTKVFASLAFTHGGGIIDEDGKVLLESPNSIKAAQIFERMRDERLVTPEVLSQGFSDVQAALINGQAAMAVPYWSAAWGMLTDRQRERIGIAEIPGVRMPDGTIRRHAFVQSMALVMNAASSRKAAAWQFLSYLGGRKGSQINANDGGLPPLKSIVLDSKRQEKNYEYVLAAKVLQSAQTIPATIIYPSVQESFNSAFANLMTGKTSAEGAMKEAAEAIRAAQKRQ
jgi:multiple sugar transport system substrate-binding protein